MNTADAIRERILELCHENNCTIHGLSVKSAMNQSTIRNFIDGKTKSIGIVTIKIICDGLGISLIDFFNKDVFKGVGANDDN